MSFETPEIKNTKVLEASTKLQEVVNITKVDELEKAIRFMSPVERQKLYDAVEMAKTSKTPLA